MLHLRPLIPDEPEMVPEDTLEYIQLFDDKGKELNEWIHFDPETHRAIKGKKLSGKPRMVPTGSMKHMDHGCSDCGAALVNGSEPFRFMVCSRLDRKAPFGFVVGTNDEGQITRLIDTAAPKPKPNTVMECGRLGLEDTDV